MMSGTQTEPAYESIVLINGRPAVLTDVYTEGFFSDCIQHLRGKVFVSAVEIDALRQGISPSNGIC